MRYDSRLFSAWGPDFSMQYLLEYLPVVAFFSAYFYADIYFATGVLMVAMPIGLLIQWMLTRKINRIYMASTALVLILGSATLFFRNPDFIKLKPSVLNWAFALAFFASRWIGEKTFAQRMLGAAAELKPEQWVILNNLWSGFFLIVGTLNIYVAYSYPEDVWVKFKLFGMLGLTLIFVIIQAIWLASAMRNNPPETNQGD